MTRWIKKTTASQRGFTLIELVVVIAILGVLAAVATPLMVNFLAGAKAEAYNADVGIIQTAVDAWFTDPSNVRFLGKNQYPIFGRGVGLPTDAANPTNRTGHTVRCSQAVKDAGDTTCVVGSFAHPDDGTPLVESHRDSTSPAEKPDWNPLGGTQGADLLKATSLVTGAAIIAWTDDGDGVREIVPAPSSHSDPKSPDTWTTIKVTLQNKDYFVDPRYYFVDVAALVTAGFLKEAPKSSSKDNSATGTGSYTYYLDNLGRVQTLPFAFPRTNGFSEGVYP